MGTDNSVRTRTVTGTLLVIASGVLWGLMGIFVRSLGALGFSSMQIVSLRVTIAVIILAIVLAVKDRSLFRIKLKDIWCFIGTGICSIAFFSFCYFTTIELTSLSAAAILLYTAPIMVTIMAAILFKEKITAKKVIAALAAVSGCALVTGVFGGGFSVSGMGILTGLGSAFGYALYSIFGRYALNRGYGSMTITFWTFLFAAVGTIPFANIPDMAEKISAAPSALIITALMAVVVTVLPYLCYTAGLDRIESGKASVIASVEPVMATIVGAVVFHEGLTLSAAAGIILVISSIFLLKD